MERNANAVAAGRVAGVDPIEQITKRCIRIVKTPEVDFGGCALCRFYTHFTCYQKCLYYAPLYSWCQFPFSYMNVNEGK